MARPKKITSPDEVHAVGYGALIKRFSLPSVPHHCQSFIHPRGERKTVVGPTGNDDFYPPRYRTGETLGDQLAFALKNEGVNLTILTLVFQKAEAAELVKYIRSTPTGKYARRAWFLYEFLTGKRLPLADLNQGRYDDLLPEDKYFTGPGDLSRRHMIRNNLLGNRAFCPVIRKTTALDGFIRANLDQRCLAVLKKYPNAVLKRALDYLFTKETKSSFEIERVTPDQKRAGRFVELLRRAGREEYLTKAALLDLQHAIVDERFANSDYRATQNYVGETVRIGQERIHFVSPKPLDLPDLMAGLLDACRQMEQAKVNPVLTATVAAFGFVFMHPFDDGNGRMHRFLIHHILARSGFSPEGVIFPVSATMLKQRAAYDETLELFSKPLMPLVDYRLDEQTGEMTVTNETGVYYRYIDFTVIAEHLFRFIGQTIETELSSEFDFLTRYDQAKQRIQDIVDMPDHSIDLFIRLCVPSQGHLTGGKRQRFFGKLTDEEITAMETCIREVFRQK